MFVSGFFFYVLLDVFISKGIGIRMVSLVLIVSEFFMLEFSRNLGYIGIYRMVVIFFCSWGLVSRGRLG